MNIMITDYCNLSCEYCFAKNEMTKDGEITLENFNYILNFLKHSNEQSVNLIGGEPTLHSDFGQILNMIKECDFKAVNIYTNGLFGKKVLETIYNFNMSVPINLIINLNSPKIIGDIAYNKILSNMKELIHRGVSIVLGLNLFEPNYDYDFFFDAVYNLNIQKVRWSVVVPLHKPINIFLYYKSFVDSVIRFLQKCHDLNCETFCDCNRIPACAFDDEQLRQMIYLQPDYFISHKCKPVLDVDINLNVFRCFATSNLLKLNLRDFSNITEIYSFFCFAIDKRNDNNQPQKCKLCNSSKNCRNGCISINKGE